MQIVTLVSMQPIHDDKKSQIYRHRRRLVRTSPEVAIRKISKCNRYYRKVRVNRINKLLPDKDNQKVDLTMVPSCLDLVTARNEVWGKVIFSVVCVKNSVHGGCGIPACIWQRLLLRPGHLRCAYCRSGRFPAGEINNSQTATVVVIRQSLGSWSLLWSLYSHSGCGSTCLLVLMQGLAR